MECRQFRFVASLMYQTFSTNFPFTGLLGGSRTLYGMARENHAPKIFLRTNRSRHEIVFPRPRHSVWILYSSCRASFICFRDSTDFEQWVVSNCFVHLHPKAPYKRAWHLGFVVPATQEVDVSFKFHDLLINLISSIRCSGFDKPVHLPWIHDTFQLIEYGFWMAPGSC